MPAPHPDQIRDAWRRALLPASPAGDVPDRARWLGLLLEGLPLIAAGQVQDETNGTLTLARLITRALTHDQAATWQIDVTGTARPFLCELARRSLGLGHLSGAHPDEDPVLHPQHAGFDLLCVDAPLALARAVTAIELHHAGLLAIVVARHLQWRIRETGAGRSVPLRPGLAPLLEDLTAQCLLVSAFLGCTNNAEHDETEWLLRRLVMLYEEERNAGKAEWPAGPLVACAALGLLLRRPREATLVTEFKDRVLGWLGWRDVSAWPTRLPAADLAGLMTRVTERVAGAIGASYRWLWPRPALARLLEECWPPLLSFCVPG
jgi:hypothetical protein